MAEGLQGPHSEQELQQWVVRREALELAVKTVARADGFSTYEVVVTASLYERYIADGIVPSPPAPIASSIAGG